MPMKNTVIIFLIVLQAGLVLFGSGAGCALRNPTGEDRSATNDSVPGAGAIDAPVSARELLSQQQRLVQDAASVTNTPEPEPSDQLQQAVLRPGLLVNVTVIVAGKKQIEEVGRRVSEGGTLSLPLLRPLAVDGEALGYLTARLTSEYREYFVEPQVMVEFVREDQPESISPWGSITVLGRVKRPGRVSIPPTRGLTVSAAIQQAGGFDTSARDTAISVTRRGPDGQTTTHQINLRAVGARGELENDIDLLPNDVVYVPQLLF